jgi:cobalamin biosynthesis Mg chelatase CobN
MRMPGKLWMLGIVLFMLAAAAAPMRARAQAQTQDKHVVSVDELNKDAAQPAERRQANEAAVRQLLSSEAGQQALKSANIEYQQVNKAIGQLSDEDLSKIAERSREAQQDFAAGGLSSRLLIVIILIVVLIIALSVVFS